MDKRMYNISIRGRVTYLIMCFERYVTQKYPERNWIQVDDMMWKICDDSDYIDNSAYRYMEIVPEYLYERNTYEELEFDYLSKEDYEMFKSTIPKDDSDLNVIMYNIYWTTMLYAYGAIPKGAPDTIHYIQEVEDVMKKNNIELPNFSLIEKFTVKNVADEGHWWGHVFDGRYLSIIMKPKQ